MPDSKPASANRAVFLSYASQDAAAARRICDALRGAGVEVWFDQSELVGGDQWDRKIRGQVKSCTLFVPVISANTQSRLEGYFRLEWKLAAQRTHTMADAKPFLLPVVIDATRDAEAHVPEEFRAVQWTRLAGGETNEAFSAQVKKLLGGEVALASGLPSVADAGRKPALPRLGRRVPAAAWAVAGIAALAAIVFLSQRRGETASAPNVGAGPRPPTPEKTVSPQSAVSDARKLVLQARTLIDDDWLAVRENFRNADDLCERATKLDPLDGEAWATWSRVAVEMIIRSYDSSPQRMEAARSQAERALQLAPDSVEGNLAMALVLRQNQSAKDATQRLRALLARAPMDGRVARALAATLSPPGRRADPEASDIRLNHPAFGGKDPRPLMDEARTMHDSQRFAECEILSERAATMAPCLEYYRFLLVYPAYSVNEPEGSRTVLAQVPARLLQEDVFAGLAAGIWLKLGNGDNALAALRRVPRDYLEDIWVSGTKGLVAGRAHALAGRTAAAQAEWNQALKVIDQQLVSQPNDPGLLGEKALLLALVGRKDEAEKTWQLTTELRRWPRGAVGLYRAEILLAEGETEAAIQVIASNLVPIVGGQVLLTVNMIHTDPWFAPVRDDPRVRKLLADGDALIRKFREKPAPAAEKK